MSMGRLPPSDPEAETAVIAAILLETSALERAGELLLPEHFYNEPNRRIFEAALGVSASSTPVDIVSVAGWLRDKGRLDQVGGPAYLAQISGEVPAVANIEGYVRRVFDKFRTRQVILTCQRIAAEGYGDVGSVDDYIDRAEQDLARAGQAAVATEEKTLGECAAEAYDGIVQAYYDPDHGQGIKTGLSRLDEILLHGLKPGKLTIIAANPGMGKSVLCETLALNVGKSNGGVVGVQVFSPEMSSEELGERALAAEAEIDGERFRFGLHAEEWQRVQGAIATTEKLPIFVNDDADITVPRLVRRVRKRKKEFVASLPLDPNRHIGIVIVDYLQLVNTEQKKSQSREEALGEATKALKVLAKREKVHVIAVSSLNRELEKRQNKRPQLGDLRESGSIGFHADNILFLYRESFYHPDCAEPDVVECNVAKQRGGPTGMVRLRFNMKQSRFENLRDWPHDPPHQNGLHRPLLPSPSIVDDPRYP